MPGDEEIENLKERIISQKCMELEGEINEEFNSVETRMIESINEFLEDCDNRPVVVILREEHLPGI